MYWMVEEQVLWNGYQSAQAVERYGK